MSRGRGRNKDPRNAQGRQAAAFLAAEKRRLQKPLTDNGQEGGGSLRGRTKKTGGKR